ncbi:hypothetical protein J3T78_11600 [Staphylococcus nepalensis]|uniref:Uncharacterized protein n=1 Tax=Staphylococcus nepalensis TaxID=214473 RepID=A0ABS3L327_9STAP|nr:hypothetical protein [Staphylococcus nepalensis]MBO1213043.1 hypothetical protein [Staphylococcus nepalensis]MBO1217146.1 hypothetical protein [Staphylococcus nepalensis]MBO1227963.1 hypothetical protein [Staphylococcus nepalensis]MBO1235800.1 hypothetical protein [Staphylococcus nepalensis]MBO1238349.1 hypothetical protein [Staphylococcus nepalensis]
MWYRDVVNKIVARLPTDISNVSESYLDNVIKRYVTKHEDIEEVKQCINDMKNTKQIKTYKDFITKK